MSRIVLLCVLQIPPLTAFSEPRTISSIPASIKLADDLFVRDALIALAVRHERSSALAAASRNQRLLEPDR